MKITIEASPKEMADFIKELKSQPLSTDKIIGSLKNGLTRISTV